MTNYFPKSEPGVRQIRRGGWEPTGRDERASVDLQLAAQTRRRELYAEAVTTQKHMLVATVAYAVTPPFEDGMRLDTTNLIAPVAVSCYICEQLWVDVADPNFCPGEPR